MTQRFTTGFGETITVTPDRGTAVSNEYDANGDLVYAPATDYTVANVAVGVTSSIEDGGQMVITDAELYCPPGTVLSPSSRITIRGVPGYQIEGDIAVVTNPYTGVTAGVVAKVRKGS